MDYFLHFYPPNSAKNLNFEKLKKACGDIIILHMCTINDHHMIYGPWDIECDRQNFLSVRTIFCSFTPLTTQKIKIKKKEYEKTAWRYYHFTQVSHKWQSHDLWLLRYWGRSREFFVILDHYLHFYPPNNPKNQNFEKILKCLEISSFYICVPKVWSNNVPFLRYGAWQM